MNALVRILAKVVNDNTGAVRRLPVLLSDDGPVIPLLRYLHWHSHARSLNWCEKVAYSAELLLNYVAVNGRISKGPETLFNAFAQALYDGTIDASNGLDPSGLYWRPMRTEYANRILGMLADFSDWLAKQGFAQPLNPVDLSPRRHELVLAMAAYEHRRARAFLGHTRKTAYEALPIVRVTPLRHASTTDSNDQPSSFPDDQFLNLLASGFVRRGMTGNPDSLTRINTRDALIALLMHGGGLRLSECFHLFVHDVQADPTDPSKAIVRVYHPSEGMPPDDWRDAFGKPAKNRADYLALKYGRRPRHIIGGAEHAGWKGNVLDSTKTKSMTVTWRDDNHARVFMALWLRLLRERTQYHCNHPYAFISVKKGQRHGHSPGRPYRITAYKEAHRRAVERIGLVVAKANGTTPHGHRHAMGQFLTDIELAPAAIQKILHHRALASQEPYTRPSQAKASQMLGAALDRINGGEASVETNPPKRQDISELLSQGFADVDPDGLLSGLNPKLLRKRA